METKKILADVLSQTTKAEDLECDPDTVQCIKAMVTAKNIDSKESKKQLEKIAEIINSASDKYQEIITTAQKLQMYIEGIFKDFIQEFRNFCGALKIYYNNLSDATSLENIKQSFLAFQYNYQYRFLPAYEEAKKEISSLREFSGQKTTRQNLWSWVTWIWKYKFTLYVTGVLLYNINLYVFPVQITDGLNVLVRLVGTICYTFASNRAILSKCLGMIGKFILFMGGSMTTSMFPFLSSLFSNAILKKLLSVGSCVVFYILTYFSVNTVSYISKIICQSILAISAGYVGFDDITMDIWEFFESQKRIINNNIEQTYNFIASIIQNSSMQLLTMLQTLCIDYFTNGFVLPAYDFITTLPQRAVSTSYSWVKNLFFKSSDSAVALFDTEQEIVEELTDDAKMEQVFAIFKVRLEKYNKATDLSNTQLVAIKNELSVALTNVANEATGLALTYANETYEKVVEVVESRFENILETMGTKKLWNDLKEIKFDNNILPYMYIVLFIFSLVSMLTNSTL